MHAENVLFRLTEDDLAVLSCWTRTDCPHFVIHRPIGCADRPARGWTLSHRVSSAYLASGFRTRELAFEAAQKLAPLADWSLRDPKTPLTDEQSQRVADTLRGFG